MGTKPGRNDPCYCGSGKKYKRCHLPLDEAEAASRAHAQATAEPPDEPGAESVQGMGDLGQGAGVFGNIGQIFKMAKNSGLLKRSPELRQLFRENEYLLNYAKHHTEIEAASAKLEPYEEEFQALFQDRKAFLRRNEAVFDEQRFVPLRFAAADVERAFRKLGQPPADEQSDEAYEFYRRAILFLTPKELRNKLSAELLIHVPKYVEQGRFIDALVLNFAAQVTTQEPNEPNVFLWCMFLHGMRAWDAQREEEQKAAFREMGLDLTEGMDLDETESWLAEQCSDPAKNARLEQLLKAHPELARQSKASLEIGRREAINLLDRPDGACLMLGFEELAPLIPSHSGKFQQMLQQYGPSEGEAAIPQERREEACWNVYLPAVRDMSKRIFTPERIQRLVADMKAYRKRLFDAGEKKAAYYLSSAISYVEHEDDPSLNTFLINLCAKSLSNLGTGAGGEAKPGESAPASAGAG